MQGIKDILDALKQLQSTIYLACDEKPADDISKIVRDAVTEITSLREQLEIAKKDGWISVQDRLPEEHLLAGGNWTYSEKVIVFNSDGVNIQRFVNGDCFGNPTHWQPLPNPPKE